MASEIATNRELLRTLSQSIHNRRTLYSLCLVDHAFHEVFSPRLWRHLDLDHSNAQKLQDPAVFQALVSSPCLQHVRELTLRAGLVPDTETGFPYEMNVLLQGLLKNLPNLQSFRYEEAKISHDVLMTLANIATLQHLHLHFSKNMGYSLGFLSGKNYYDSEAWASHGPHFGNPYPYLIKFRNLTSLTLHNMWVRTDMQLWIDCLGKMLPNNPHLQLLDLSFDMKNIERCQRYEDDLERDRRSYVRFFHDICSRYSATSKNRLQLKSLILGNIGILSHLADVTTALDLSGLEVMDVGSVKIAPEGMPWDLARREVTPRLKWLTIYNFNADIFKTVDAESIFAEDDKRRTQVSIGSRYMGSTFKRDMAAFTERASPCIVGFEDKPSMRMPGLGSDILMLTWMPSLAFLSVPGMLSSSVTVPAAYKPITDQTIRIMRQFVADAPSLRALQFAAHWTRDEGEHHTLDAIKHERLEDILIQIIGGSGNVRYIKVGYMGWSILPRSVVASGSSRLVALDRWENAVEQPAWIWR